MYLIFGLGNPGNRYRLTRHNIGFMVLEKLAAGLEIDLKQKSFNALWGKGKLASKNVLLAMPQTYMNLSGNAVRELLAFFKADINNLIVVHDDLDLPFGAIRLKTGQRRGDVDIQIAFRRSVRTATRGEKNYR